MQGIIAVNGEIFAPDVAAIPALDRGFLFGDNVFEVFVGFGARLLDVPAHLERLHSSAEELGIPIPWSDAELTFELTSIAERLAQPKVYLRLVVTRGAGLGLEVPSEVNPNRVVYGFPAKSLPSSVYEEGISLRARKLSYTERRPATKTGNYLPSILALERAQRDGYQDVLWSNSEGEITEATTANIFFIGRQGDYAEIVTPSPQSGLLKGITRGRILELLASAKIPAREAIIFADEIPRFDEAFLCSTVKGLVPVRAIERHHFHTTRPTSVYKQIERLYHAYVASTLGARVDWNTGQGLPT